MAGLFEPLRASPSDGAWDGLDSRQWNSTRCCRSLECRMFSWLLNGGVENYYELRRRDLRARNRLAISIAVQLR
jgi:hypothetical protein